MVGFLNPLVAQAAASRLPYAMARDRQLRSFPARVHPTPKAAQRPDFVRLGIGVVLRLGLPATGHRPVLSAPGARSGTDEHGGTGEREPGPPPP